MAISNNSTGLRPGVCTSSTRPTAPYEGQHIYETDTDIEYVWNGSAWVVNYVSAASPAFTGTPTAPTATAGTNTTQLATTAFANTAGGLVFIKSQTVGSGVSSVTVSDAFSTTYDNYRIIYDGGTSIGNMAINLQLGSTTSNYHWAYVFNQYSATTPLGGGTTTGANFDSVGRGSTVGNSLSCDLYGPFLSQRTGCKYLGVDYYTLGFNVNGQGFLNNATSYTAFSILAATGTMTGGTIRVYGYRNS